MLPPVDLIPALGRGRDVREMSALTPKTDVGWQLFDVHFVPKGDILILVRDVQILQQHVSWKSLNNGIIWQHIQKHLQGWFSLVNLVVAVFQIKISRSR